MPVLNLRASLGANTANFRISSRASIRELVYAIDNLIGLGDPSRLRIFSRGGQLRESDTRTVEEANVQNGDQLRVIFGLNGGYAADGIYFASPEEVPQLNLEVSFSPGLLASQIFRPGNGWSGPMRVFEWSGSILSERGYGTLSCLQERDTARKDHAITWEISPDLSNAETDPVNEHFALNDTNAVVLKWNEASAYLFQALTSFSLDRSSIERFSMRYSERLTKSNYVAIRFLDQATYEQLVPLSVSPPPDVVTRIVLLFQNLSQADVAAWPQAQARAQTGPNYWKEVIGFDERATDASLYRALEWRAIEIPAAGAAA
ncbi:unnamed protein product [Peniophora sp. CBMAI 1063]|nr:unnamed protein product [Peniophora sp. CBMAI 1063]